MKRVKVDLGFGLISYTREDMIEIIKEDIERAIKAKQPTISYKWDYRLFELIQRDLKHNKIRYETHNDLETAFTNNIKFTLHITL